MDSGLAIYFGFNLITALFGIWLAAEKNRSAVWFFWCLLFGLPALIALAGAPAVSDDEWLVNRMTPAMRRRYEKLRSEGHLTDEEIAAALRNETEAEAAAEAKPWQPGMPPPQ